MQISFQDVMQTSSIKKLSLGSVAETSDGRKWIYVKASEAIAKGNVVVPIAKVDVDTVSSSADAYSDIIFITEASAGWTVDAYADCWVHVNDGTGEGQAAKIKSNTTDTLILYKDYKLATALDVADSDIKIHCKYNVRKAVVTDKLQNAVGVAQVAFASGEYGYVLKEGVGVIIAGAALTEDASCVTGDDTAGEVVVGTTAKGNFDEQTIGFVISGNTNADKGSLVEIKL